MTGTAEHFGGRARAASQSLMHSRKGYCEGGGGQVHWRVWEPDQPGDAPDLLCLHPAPFSGLAFQNLAPLLAASRRVIAPDYPGYGGSCALDRVPTIGCYAKAMDEVGTTLCGDAQVDVLGFHTGTLVAAEWSLIEPQRIRKACLIDIPALEPGAAQGMAEKFAQPFEVSDDLVSLEKPWNSTLKSRLETQGARQALAMLAEQLRAGEGMNAAFHAAFTYPWREQFARLGCETRIIATQSGLLDGTRKAAATIPGARLVERLDIKRSVLDEAAERTAGEVLSFLQA